MSAATVQSPLPHHAGLDKPVHASVPVSGRGPPGQPDIAYAPDYDKYVARTKRRLETDDEGARTRSVLPPGFPAKLESPLVWEGETLSASFDWNYRLTEANLAELDAALQHFKALNLPVGLVSVDTFPLPGLHDTLRAISHEVHHGHGFKVVRGVPVRKYSRQDVLTLYAGLASHVAPVRGRQDRTADGADVVLAHIRDLTATVDAATIGAPAYTTEKQVFHTDIGDVIALFALGEAHEGGQSYLSSSWRVYNELAATRPDLIRTLSEPWPFDEFGKDGRSYQLRPLLHYTPASEDGSEPEHLIIQYARRVFTGYWGLPRSANIPPITEAQAEALDALHFLAEKYAVSLDFHEGDIQFANNLSIFHARGAFVDSEEKHRHLVRLWLRDPENAWKKTAELEDRWERIYGNLHPETAIVPPEPYVRNASKGETKGLASPAVHSENRQTRALE